MSKALEAAITVLEAEIANFVTVDQEVKTSSIDFDSLTDRQLDELDAKFGHTAACEAVKAAEMRIVRLHCYAGDRKSAPRDIAASERDWKLRNFIVRQAWATCN